MPLPPVLHNVWGLFGCVVALTGVCVFFGKGSKRLAQWHGRIAMGFLVFGGLCFLLHRLHLPHLGVKLAPHVLKLALVVLAVAVVVYGVRFLLQKPHDGHDA